MHFGLLGPIFIVEIQFSISRVLTTSVPSPEEQIVKRLWGFKSEGKIWLPFPTEFCGNIWVLGLEMVCRNSNGKFVVSKRIGFSRVEGEVLIVLTLKCKSIILIFLSLLEYLTRNHLKKKSKLLDRKLGPQDRL